MHSFIWASISIVSVIFIVFILALFKINITDIIYSMLSGSVVGVAICLFALSKSASASRASRIMFACVLSSAIGWIISLVFLKLTTLNIFGDAALAFDLVIGILVSFSVGAQMLEHKVSKEHDDVSNHELFK